MVIQSLHCSTFRMLPQSRNGTTAAARLIQPHAFNGEGGKNMRPNRRHCCHYSLSQLTGNSSSSDSDDSSEESPQSHDSSESASQEVILAAFSRVPLRRSVSTDQRAARDDGRTTLVQSDCYRQSSAVRRRIISCFKTGILKKRSF